MKAVLFKTKEEPLQVAEVETPAPAGGEILIQLKYAALNHLDLWIWQEQILDKPVITGADGSGIVTAVGKEVDQTWVGKEVVVNPSLYWGANEKITGPAYQILGNPTNGTFAEYIKIPQEYVFEKPAHLNLREAAALPLAALTAYRALFTKAQITSSDKILVTGIGGGAALFLLQMARAIGATVYTTSSSPEKIQKAISLGAEGGFNYHDKSWVQQAKEMAGGFDVIIDSAGGDGFAQLTEVANPGARIVLFGRTAGNINNLQPKIIFNKQLHIMGTTMGSETEFKSMLAFYEKHRLRPVIDSEFNLEAISDAREHMKKGNHFGKVLIRITEGLKA